MSGLRIQRKDADIRMVLDRAHEEIGGGTGRMGKLYQDGLVEMFLWLTRDTSEVTEAPLFGPNDRRGTKP